MQFCHSHCIKPLALCIYIYIYGGHVERGGAAKRGFYACFYYYYVANNNSNMGTLQTLSSPLLFSRRCRHHRRHRTLTHMCVYYMHHGCRIAPFRKSTAIIAPHPPSPIAPSSPSSIAISHCTISHSDSLKAAMDFNDRVYDNFQYRWKISCAIVDAVPFWYERIRIFMKCLIK